MKGNIKELISNASNEWNYLKFLLTTRLHFFERAFGWKLGYTESLDLFG